MPQKLQREVKTVGNRQTTELLPYLDPEFIPNHPANHMPEDLRTDEQKYWLKDLTPAQRRKQEKEWLEIAMNEWTPPHVPRSWENRMELAEFRARALSMKLGPKPHHPFQDLVPVNPNDSSISRIISQELYNPGNDPDKTDFRRFMNVHFQLAYHRFHLSHGDPHFPSEEVSMQQYGPDDPQHTEFPEEDTCFIMEYTDMECSTIRRRLAFMMGLFPAVIDPENELFDEEIAWRYGESGGGKYGRRLYVRCRRRNKRCLRPSHIILFGSNFEILP